jgi:hypothetical protein
VAERGVGRNDGWQAKRTLGVRGSERRRLHHAQQRQTGDGKQNEGKFVIYG